MKTMEVLLMEEIIKKTQTYNSKQESHSAQNIVGIVFGVFEATLAFRLVFKLLGANPENRFVQSLYSVTQGIAGFFEGIFPRFVSTGAENTSIFEPATLIAMVVLAVFAWIALKMVTPRITKLMQRTEYTKNNNWAK